MFIDEKRAVSYGVCISNYFEVQWVILCMLGVLVLVGVTTSIFDNDVFD